MGRHSAPPGSSADPLVAAALAHRNPEGEAAHRGVRPAAAANGLGWPGPPSGGRGLGWAGDLPQADPAEAGDAA